MEVFKVEKGERIFPRNTTSMSKGPEGSWSSECVGTREAVGRNQPRAFKAELAQVGVAGPERSTGTMKNHKGFRL